jgi:hypothetical protein
MEIIRGKKILKEKSEGKKKMFKKKKKIIY